MYISSLVALADIERLSGQLLAARQRLEEAVSACTQPLITHSNGLPSVLIGFGHLACAEQDWQAARQSYNQALRCKGCDAAATQEAYSGLAEVAWAGSCSAQAHQLLTGVIDNPATSAATRQQAKRLLA